MLFSSFIHSCENTHSLFISSNYLWLSIRSCYLAQYSYCTVLTKVIAILILLGCLILTVTVTAVVWLPHTLQVGVPSDRRPSSDSHTHHSNTGTTTNQSTAESDYDICVEFYQRTCGCQRQMESLFTLEHFVDIRSQASQMCHLWGVL